VGRSGSSHRPQLPQVNRYKLGGSGSLIEPIGFRSICNWVRPTKYCIPVMSDIFYIENIQDVHIHDIRIEASMESPIMAAGTRLAIALRKLDPVYIHAVHAGRQAMQRINAIKRRVNFAESSCWFITRSFCNSILR